MDSVLGPFDKRTSKRSLQPTGPGSVILNHFQISARTVPVIAPYFVLLIYCERVALASSLVIDRISSINIDRHLNDLVLTH